MPPPSPEGDDVTIVDYNAHLYIAELARDMAERGFNVTYLFCVPSSGLSSEQILRLEQAGVEVKNVPADGFEGITPDRQLSRRAQIRLGIALARCASSGTVVGCQLPLVTNWTLFNATRLRRSRYANWVQEYQTNRSSKGSADRPSRFERSQICAAHHVLCSTHEFSLDVSKLGRSGPTTALPRWAPIDLIPTCERNNPWAQLAGLDESRTRVVYCGPIDGHHRIGDISRTVKQLLEHDQFEFVFTGEGEGHVELAYDETLARSPRVHFLRPQSLDVYPQVLGAANILVATLDPESVESSASETVLSYLCAGRPVVGLMDEFSPSGEVILDAGAGPVVSDATALTDAIVEIVEDPESAVLASKRARAYAERFFGADTTTANFVEAIGLESPAGVA